MRNYYDELICAIFECDISAVQSLLQDSGTVTAKEVFHLCDEAMRAQCQTDTITEIMEHGPSVKDLLDYDPNLYLIPGQNIGFLELVVRYDRADLLRYLLDRGGNPNRRQENWSSALEIALHYNAPCCVHELLRCPSIDMTITEQMRRSWGRLGMEIPRGFPALCEVAGMLFGLATEKMTSYEDIPLFPGMTAFHAAYNRNWTLLDRICKVQGITDAQCSAILEGYEQYCYELSLNNTFKETDALQDAAKLLDTLFSLSPDLLHSDHLRSMLVTCMLQNDEAVNDILTPWLQQMDGNEIILKNIGYGPFAQMLSEGMENWGTICGHHFTPVLDRKNPLPFAKAFGVDSGKIIQDILPSCQIIGEVPQNGISRLAQGLINISLLYPPEVVKTILATEDADAVLAAQKQTHARVLQLKRELDLYR